MSAAAHLHAATDARSGRRRREIDRSQPCESEIASIRVMLHRGPLWLLACTSAALTPLENARRRGACEARKAFAAEVARPKPDDLAIAIAVAAEEPPDEPLAACQKRVTDALDELAARATTRARLELMLGDRSGAAVVARAVGAAMFGDQGLPEENNTSIEFFAGDVDDYYNPANSLIDEVIRRRRGIPITMSLVFARACEVAGAPMSLLNTPMHVLVAPDDTSETFVVDAFGGGNVLENARNQLTDVSPLEGLSLAARMLRNLRMIYEKGEDPARLLGVVERTLLVAEQDVEMKAVPERERAHCRATVGVCLLALRDEDRRDECLGLLRAAKQEFGEGGKFFRMLLADPFLN